MRYHEAYVSLKFSELARLLNLPEGTRVLGVAMEWDQPDVIAVRVEHASLPSREEGQMLMHVTVHDTVEGDRGYVVTYR